MRQWDNIGPTTFGNTGIEEHLSGKMGIHTFHANVGVHLSFF